MKISYPEEVIIKKQSVIIEDSVIHKIVLEHNQGGLRLAFFKAQGIEVAEITITNELDLIIQKLFSRPNHDHDDFPEFRKQTKEGWGWYDDWPRDGKIERISLKMERVDY